MLVFLIIIGVSFAVMASRLTGFVSDYLYQQRIREDSLSVEKLATTVAPLFQSASGDALNETLQRSASELGGRLLVLEECVESGCVGQELVSKLLEKSITPSVRLVNLGSDFVTHGTVPQLHQMLGLDGKSVANKVKELFIEEAAT